MSITLTYGHKKPTDGDDSAQWFDNIQDNVVLDDAHNHNGVNSAAIDSQAIAKVDTITKAISDWSGSAGAWTLTIANSEIPSGFKSSLKSSSSLTSLVIMDTDNSDERVYMKYTWFGAGNTATVTLTSNTKFNLKILFV